MFVVAIIDGDIMLSFIFSQYLRLNTVAYIKSLMEKCCPGQRRWLLEDLTSDKRTLHRATQTKESIVGWLVGWLVGFDGISTFSDNLTPNPFLSK